MYHTSQSIVQQKSHHINPDMRYEENIWHHLVHNKLYLPDLHLNETLLANGQRCTARQGDNQPGSTGYNHPLYQNQHYI